MTRLAVHEPASTLISDAKEINCVPPTTSTDYLEGGRINMAGSKLIVTALIGALLTSACGNTVYGPRRLIQAGYVDDGDDALQRDCPATRPSTRAVTPMNLTYEFHDRACDSLRQHGDTALARRMLDAGITLNRMRCNDFLLSAPRIRRGSASFAVPSRRERANHRGY